jgi:hypothetical protein
MVAIVVSAKTILHVRKRVFPSQPAAVKPTTAPAAMLLFRQIPFPADPPTACRANNANFSAAIVWILPKVKLDTVVEPEKNEPSAPKRGLIMKKRFLEPVGQNCTPNVRRCLGSAPTRAAEES